MRRSWPTMFCSDVGPTHLGRGVFLALLVACGGGDDGNGAAPGALPNGPFGTLDASVLAGPGLTGAAAAGGFVAGGASTAGLGGVAGGGLSGPDGARSGAAGCTGLTQCGAACVNTLADADHCGACGQVCRGQCQAGRCVDAGAGADGCSDTAVTGLSLSEISVYQSIKVTIMANQTALARAQRKADVVQGRDALFRVHVTPAAGYTPRQVAARLTLSNGAGGAPEQFFAKLAPSGPSTDEKAESAFLIKVPAESVRADTSYAVSLVECAADPPPGLAQAARYPADGFAPLEARATGPLRVHIVPLDTGATIPETSSATLEIYRKRIMAVYPITKIEFTVGAPLKSSATSMCNHLAAIAARRSADGAPVDLYYYGLTPGLSGGQSGCSNAVASASSGGKTAVGWSTINDPDKGERGASTMAHELGHSHGRLHAPCNVQDPDPNYPYPQADTGIWGYDARAGIFLPPTRKDMMSYCPNPDRAQAWLSDYTYRAILERVAAVNALVGTRMFVQGGAKHTWRQLVVDHAGEHWGEYPLVVQGAPEGTLLSATVRRSDGTTTTVSVYKQELEDGASEHPYLLLVPEPQSAWRTIELPGLLAARAF